MEYMFEALEKTWVIVVEPCKESQLYGQAERLYWGSKKGYATLTDDIAEATHFKTVGAARGKVTALRGRDFTYLYVHKNDRVFVGAINTPVLVREVAE